MNAAPLRRSQFDQLIGLDIADGEFDAPAGLSSGVAEGRALSVDSALQGGEALRRRGAPRCAKPGLLMASLKPRCGFCACKL
jgi:hypothetical protein